MRLALYTLLTLITHVLATYRYREKIAGRYLSFYSTITPDGPGKPEKATLEYMDLKFLLQNGIREDPEDCDDGNSLEGDGCDAQIGLLSCGFKERTKTNPLSYASYFPVCGDGFAVPDYEMCDDGNTEDGDGCSSKCRIEHGYHCKPMFYDFYQSASDEARSLFFINMTQRLKQGKGIIPMTKTDFLGPSVCRPCSELKPSVCTLRCPDHFVDDHTKSCTSCYAASALQCGNVPGCPFKRWEFRINTPSAEPLQDASTFTDLPLVSCSPICGDGYINGNEECDSFDSYCLSTCKLDPAYTCTYYGSSFFSRSPQNPYPLNHPTSSSLYSQERVETPPQQPNNIHPQTNDPSQQNNKFENIDPEIRIAEFENYNIQPICSLCGDGVFEPKAEACDGLILRTHTAYLMGEKDQAIEYNIFCNKVCEWQADLSQSVCGNGRLEMNEECDDGNLLADDGCSPFCKIELGYQCTTPALQSSFCTVKVGSNVILPSKNHPIRQPVCTEITGCPFFYPVCEDGNLDNNDGCDVYGRVESGWVYLNPFSPQNHTCYPDETCTYQLVPYSRDGVLVGKEECDCNQFLGTCLDEIFLSACKASIGLPVENQNSFTSSSSSSSLMNTMISSTTFTVQAGYSCIWKTSLDHPSCAALNPLKQTSEASIGDDLQLMCIGKRYKDLPIERYGYSECLPCNDLGITQERCQRDCLRDSYYWDHGEKRCKLCSLAKTELSCLNCSAKMVKTLVTNMLLEELGEEFSPNDVVQKIQKFQFPNGFWWSDAHQGCLSCRSLSEKHVTSGFVCKKDGPVTEGCKGYNDRYRAVSKSIETLKDSLNLNNSLNLQILSDKEKSRISLLQHLVSNQHSAEKNFPIFEKDDHNSKTTTNNSDAGPDFYLQFQMDERYQACFKTEQTCPGYHFPKTDIFNGLDPHGTKFELFCEICPIGYACGQDETGIGENNGYIYEIPKPCLEENREYSDVEGLMHCKKIPSNFYCSYKFPSEQGMVCTQVSGCTINLNIIKECGACQDNLCLSCAKNASAPSDKIYFQYHYYRESHQSTDLFTNSSAHNTYHDSEMISKNLLHQVYKDYPETVSTSYTPFSGLEIAPRHVGIRCTSCATSTFGKTLANCAPDAAAECDYIKEGEPGFNLPNYFAGVRPIELMNVKCSHKVPLMEEKLFERKNMCVSSYHRLQDNLNKDRAGYESIHRACETCLNDPFALKISRCMTNFDLGNCVTMLSNPYDTQFTCKIGRCANGHSSYYNTSGQAVLNLNLNSGNNSPVALLNATDFLLINLFTNKLIEPEAPAPCIEILGHLAEEPEHARHFVRLYHTDFEGPNGGVNIKDAKVQMEKVIHHDPFITACENSVSHMLVYNQQAYAYRYPSFKNVNGNIDHRMANVEVPMQYLTCSRGRMTCRQFFDLHKKEAGYSKPYTVDACCTMYGDTHATSNDFTVAYLTPFEQWFSELLQTVAYICQCTPPFSFIDGSCRLTCDPLLVQKPLEDTTSILTSPHCDMCSISNAFSCTECQHGLANLDEFCQLPCFAISPSCFSLACVGPNATVESCTKCHQEGYLEYKQQVSSETLKAEVDDEEYYSTATCRLCTPKTYCKDISTSSGCDGTGMYDSNACAQCVDGRYGNIADQLPIPGLNSPTCQLACHPNCKTCASGSDIFDCTECADDVYFYPIDFGCYRSCPRGTYGTDGYHTRRRCIALTEMSLLEKNELERIATPLQLETNEGVDRSDQPWWVVSNTKSKRIRCCVPCSKNCLDCVLIDGCEGCIATEKCRICAHGFDLDADGNCIPNLETQSTSGDVALILSVSVSFSILVLLLLSSALYLRLTYLYWMRVVKGENLVYPSGGIVSYALASDSEFIRLDSAEVLFAETEDEARQRLNLAW